MADFYEILGVARTATTDEIRTAYKKKASKLHPDRNKEEGAEQRFQELQEAYSILMDPVARRTYDRSGHTISNTTEDLALELLTGVLLELMQSQQFEPRDYFKDIRKQMSRFQKDNLDERTELETSIKKLRYFIANSKVDPYVVQSLEFKLGELRQRLESVIQRIATATIAAEKLKEFEYTGITPNESGQLVDPSRF